MVTFLQIIQIISGILLILLVLLHSPKNDGVVSFGGSSNLFASQKGAEAGLNKLTSLIAIAFIVSSFLLGFNVFG